MQRIIYSAIMLLFISGTALCQDTTKQTNKGSPGEYANLDNMPSFKGGQQNLNNYLATTIKYPKAARDSNIQGTVYVTFIVKADGKIDNAKIKRGIGGLCNEEALRVVKNMPDWIPGKQNGKNVDVSYTLPIKFKLK